MTVEAVCLWGILCDVAIIQKFTQHVNGIPDQTSFIELSVSQAEQLLLELRAAIDEAKRIDAEYIASIDAEFGSPDSI